MTSQNSGRPDICAGAQRCTSRVKVVPRKFAPSAAPATAQMSGRPEFWDVTYRFRGTDRYVQMARPPGRTITVNSQGEPRG